MSLILLRWQTLSEKSCSWISHYHQRVSVWLGEIVIRQREWAAVTMVFIHPSHGACTRVCACDGWSRASRTAQYQFLSPSLSPGLTSAFTLQINIMSVRAGRERVRDAVSALCWARGFTANTGTVSAIWKSQKQNLKTQQECQNLRLGETEGWNSQLREGQWWKRGRMGGTCSQTAE